jgi:PAS domain S-box-containing protein
MPEKKTSGEFGQAPEAPKGSDYAPDIVETVREPFLVLDADLRVKFANRAFCQTFKVAPGKPIGQFIYELGDGQWDIPALRKLLDELLPTNGHFDDYQVEHDFPDVGRRTMLLNARRLHDGDNKTKLILLAIEDVSERRRAELEIARQRTWFQTTLASIGDAVIATDTEARVTFLNPIAEKLTGWTQQKAMGKPLNEVFNIVNEETRKTVESPVNKAIRDGAIVGLANHTILIAKDGSERPIDDSAAPIRDDDGKIVGVVMVFHDITDRRAAEYLLEVSEVRYRRLFEAAHDGILILDAKHRKITDVNPFLLDLLDYPREYFLGKELWEIGMFRDKDESQAAMEELHEKGSVRFEDKPLKDRNGRRHPVEIVANVYQEDHQPVIQCNIRDISERKRFADERDAHLINEQSLRLEAEGANRAKDMFLATLSHEMRTPLNAIVGWMSILRKANRKVEDLEEGLAVIDRNTTAQVQLIEDVLDVSRIVSGKVRLEMRPCDLSEVIKAGIDVVRPAAEARGITLDVQLDPSARRTTCDANRIQQVIWNLLSNAIKFTPKGGRVSVALSLEQSDVRIQVSDNGQGMSPELLPYVFDRFRQADSSTRRKFGGLGLGLSIVKHLVEMHGGTVEAHSAGEGKGSTFTIRLPIKAVRIDEDPEGPREKKSELAIAPPLPLVRLDGLCVLVVDDEPDARRLLVKVLQEVGAIVTAAESGKEALELLPKVKPHVLVSDLGMPEMDGYDLIWAIRSAGHSAKELPAVALTAFAHKEHQRRALLAGFQVHVAKPVDPHDLTVVIASLAGRTGTRADSPSQ